MHALSKMICNIHVKVIYLHVISWSASFANLKIMECFNIHGSTFASATDLRRDFMFCCGKSGKDIFVSWKLLRLQKGKLNSNVGD